MEPSGNIDASIVVVTNNQEQIINRQYDVIKDNIKGEVMEVYRRKYIYVLLCSCVMNPSVSRFTSTTFPLRRDFTFDK